MSTANAYDALDYFDLFARHIHHLTQHVSGELRGLCCFHTDTKPSWSGNRHTGLWRCFGCGAQGNARQFAERAGETVQMSNGYQRERRIATTYDYRDESGALLYQVVRFDPKGFAQRKPDSNGGWSWNLADVRRVLYMLPQILTQRAVGLVEGEKDADRLWSLGLPATTCPGGAGRWLSEYNQYLAGKEVIILPDNDEAGEKHGQQVAHALLPVAAAVKLVRLPDLPAKGDISDWLDAGHTKDELAEIVKATPILRPEDLPTEQKPQSEASQAEQKLQRNGLVLTKLSDVTPQPVRWLWRGHIPLGKVTVADGDPGLGKSLLSLDIAARVSTGREMPDGTASDLSEPAGVVILSAEDDVADTIRPRLEAAGADLSRISRLTAIRKEKAECLPTLLDLAEIRTAIQQVNARLLIIDPLMAYLPGKVDSYRDQDVRRSLAPLTALAAETGVAVLVIRHLNKTEGKNALYRGGGSIGIIGAARSGLLVAKDPEDEDRRILAVAKSNLAKLPPALAYRIVVNVNEVPSLSWEGVAQHTAASLLAQPADGEDRSALEEAQDFLRAVLAEAPQPVKAVIKEADEAGIAERTLKRAKATLRVKASKTGRPGEEQQQWVWVLPLKDAKSAEEGQEKKLASFGEVGTLREADDREVF